MTNLDVFRLNTSAWLLTRVSVIMKQYVNTVQQLRLEQISAPVVLRIIALPLFPTVRYQTISCSFAR